MCVECHAILYIRRCVRFALDRQFRPEIENDLIVGNPGVFDIESVEDTLGG